MQYDPWMTYVVWSKKLSELCPSGVNDMESLRVRALLTGWASTTCKVNERCTISTYDSSRKLETIKRYLKKNHKWYKSKLTITGMTSISVCMYEPRLGRCYGQCAEKNTTYGNAEVRTDLSELQVQMEHSRMQ